MELIQTFATPAFVSALMFYLLKRWDENKKRNFEVRYAEYKKYLQTLEEIAASSRSDSEKFLRNVFADFLRTPIKDEATANAALFRMEENMSSVMSKMRESFSKAHNELHGLKLVCTDKLLKLINEFVSLQKEILDQIVIILGNWRNFDINNPEASFSGEMKTKGKRSQQLYEEIVMQMRKELRIK